MADKDSGIPKELTLKLIELYKSNEHLWLVTDRDYRDRKKRTETINKIANILGVEKSAVDKKCHNLRCQYRHERRKLKRLPNYKSGWEFFKAMDFLNFHDDSGSKGELSIRNEPVSNNDTSDYVMSLPSTSFALLREKNRRVVSTQTIFQSAAGNRNTLESIDEEFHGQSTEPARKRSRRSKKVQKNCKKTKSSTEFLLNKVEEILDSGETEDEIAAQYIATKLKKLPACSKVYAEKLIMEILFEAELENVTRSTYIIYN